jgi:hypothetical protein
VQSFDIEVIPRIHAQCLANLADAEVHAALKVDEGFRAPELPPDFCSGRNLAAARCQEGEDPKGLRLKRNRRPSLSQLPVRGVQFEVIELKYFSR